MAITYLKKSYGLYAVGGGNTMLHMEENELHQLLKREYQKGFLDAINLMEQRLLLACENGTPVAIGNKAYFIKSDLQNLQDIVNDLAEGAE